MSVKSRHIIAAQRLGKHIRSAMRLMFVLALSAGLYIDYAFKWAREADPDGKLFYNDTGGEGLGAKSDKVYALVKGLKDRGVPIDGVGLQMHLNLNNPISGKAVLTNLQRLAGLGLDVHITEMDIQTPLPLTAEKLAGQAAVYQDIW